MRQYFLFFFAACFLFIPASFAQNAITLTDPDDISDAMMLTNAIDSISDSVTSCMGKNTDNEECQCRSRGKIENFVRVYDDTMDDHPEWRDQAVYYKKPNGAGVTTMFGALQNQVDMFRELDC